MKHIFLLCSLALHSFFASAQTWEEVIQPATELFQKKEYEKAIPFAVKMLEAAEKEFGTEHSNYALSLGFLAMLYQTTGQYEKAELFYIRQIENRKIVMGEANPGYANSLNKLAGLYESMGKYEKAESLYLRSKDIRKTILGEFHPDYAQSLNDLAVLYVSMGQYEKAEPLYIGAGEIAKKVLGENHPDYATDLNNLAGLYQVLGQYEKAELLYLQSKEINKKVLGGTHPDYATDLNNLGVLYFATGQYEKAEPLYIQARDIRSHSLGDAHPDYAASLNNLGALYQAIGQYEKAEPLFIESKGIRKKSLGESHPAYAASLNNLGALYLTMGKYEKAEHLFIEAKETRKKFLSENHPDYGSSLNNLALLYTAMGEYEKAEALYIEVNEIYRRVFGKNHSHYATSLSNLGGLYSKTGEDEKSKSLYIAVNEIYKEAFGENHPDYATSLTNLATQYIKMGQYEMAEPLFLLSSKILRLNTSTTFTVLSEKEKGDYLKNKTSEIEVNNSFLYVYPKASSLVVKNNLDLQLFFKSLSLTGTRNMLAALRNHKDSSVIRLFREWQRNRVQLGKQYSLPVHKRNPGLKNKEARAESQEKELSRKSSAFRRQQEAISVSLNDVRKNLEQGEVAIEFVSFRLYNKKWTDSIIYAAYILHKNDSVPVFIPLCEERQLRQLFDSAGNSATSMVASFYRGLELKNKNTPTVGKKLYKLIWEPLEPYLKGVKRISYSPAGKLYSIAFHALPVDSTTVLMDRYQLQQYTSTRQLALRESENEIIKPSGIVLFGDANFSMDSLQGVNQKTTRPERKNISASIYTPKKRGADNNTWNKLPGTAVEVKKIKLLFDKNRMSTRAFIQTGASEENLKALDGHSPQILHIATHGFFLPEPGSKKEQQGLDQGNTYTLADDPLLRTGLILAGGNYAWSGKTPPEGVEDGIVTAYEISQLNLSNTELVVLSACETALGDVKGSEGVFGLQRAFKMAGVKKMIVSLWQVPDKETSELMVSFYSWWMKGETVNAAFTHAQAEMRKKYSPFYWAAFVLVE